MSSSSVSICPLYPCSGHSIPSCVQDRLGPTGHRTRRCSPEPESSQPPTAQGVSGGNEKPRPGHPCAPAPGVASQGLWWWRGVSQQLGAPHGPQSPGSPQQARKQEPLGVSPAAGEGAAGAASQAHVMPVPGKPRVPACRHHRHGKTKVGCPLLPQTLQSLPPPRAARLRHRKGATRGGLREVCRFGGQRKAATLKWEG